MLSLLSCGIRNETAGGRASLKCGKLLKYNEEIIFTSRLNLIATSAPY
jgi:hypothetical protein